MTTPPVRFETLIEVYHDEIYRYLWRLLHGASQGDRALEAQDLAQEVFLRAYRAFGRLRRDSNHRAWLYKIATNCAYSALKRGQHLLRHSVAASAASLSIPDDAGQSPDGQLARTETLAAVRAAIAALPPKQQAAVVLRHVQGLDYAEIAQALDCSQDSARANVYQGLRRLRRELGEDLF
jgi:RNA polymerase sigma-70 factor (ECF subfamily)